MGLPHGNRYLINDAKPYCNNTAIGYTIERNTGIENVFIEDNK